MKLVHGLYESPVTAELRAALDRLADADQTREPLTEASAPHVLARLIHDASVRAFRALPAEARLEHQVALANELLGLLGERASESGLDEGDRLSPPPELLTSVVDRTALRLGEGKPVRPTLPLRHSDLLVNGPRDLRVGNEVRRELASADRVDLLVSFVKWSGLRLFKNELSDLVSRRPGKLRVLTTTYMGASEAEAIEALLALGGVAQRFPNPRLEGPVEQLECVAQLDVGARAGEVAPRGEGAPSLRRKAVDRSQVPNGVRRSKLDSNSHDGPALI